MPTKKTKTKKGKEKVIRKKRKIPDTAPKIPSKFILQIKKCGTDTKNFSYDKIESDNAVIIALNGIDQICDGLTNEENKSFLKYLIACGLLKGINYNQRKLFDNIKNLAEIISSLSLSSLEGGNF